MKNIEKIKSELIAIQDFLKDKQFCIVITKDSIECLSSDSQVQTINFNNNNDEE